ncbi:hypothetical protein N665_0172s0013, partial [Sinapis alba]
HEFMLDHECYGHWKVKMKASLQSIDMDVWVSLENGYEVPKTLEKDGIMVNKSLTKWTKHENEISRYNAKKQPDLIQGCKNAKEMWYILQTHFGRTKKGSCSGQGIQGQETGAEVLRCMPQRYTTYKTTMFVSLNIDKFIFHEVVGMWKGHEKVGLSKQRQEAGEPCINTEVQCYKCIGYGYFIKECPTAKRRRFKNEVLNLIALGAHKDEASTSSESDSEFEKK